MEFTGLEEVMHVPDTVNQQSESVGRGGNGNGKSKPQPCGNGRATQAQIRALHALTKKAGYSDEDLQSLLQPLSAASFTDLTKESASQVITYLQTEVAQ